MDRAEPGFVVRLPSAEVARDGIRRRVEMIALADLARIRLVSGRLPRPVALPGPTATAGDAVRIEAVLSEETARQMKVRTGDALPFATGQSGNQ